MVGENKNDTEVMEKQKQEGKPDIDGVKEEITTKAENDVKQAHSFDDEIRSQDPDSPESIASQELVAKADEGLENFKTQIETETNDLELSNDDLKFFMDILEKRGLGNTDVFLFVQNELEKREKNDIDYDPIEFSKKQDEKDEKDLREDIERMRSYSDERLIMSINDCLELVEESMKRRNITAAESLEAFMIEEKIEEAKNVQRNIDPAMIEKFKNDLNDLKEKIYLVSVMGALDKASELADKFNDGKDIECKESAVYWIFNARDIENKNLDKINKFDLEEIDKKIKEICAVIGLDEDELSKEWFRKNEKDHQRFGAIFKEINKETPFDPDNLETKENFISQFKDGEEVYNFLKKGSDIEELWKLTTKEDRGRLVDMMVGFAIENDLPKDEIRSLAETIEMSEHIGKIKSYKWLYGLEPIAITGDGPDSRIMAEVDETGVELGKEYKFGNKEFEILKFFFGPKGGDRWNSALNILLWKIEGDLELLSTDVKGYNVKKHSENSIALLLILEDRKVSLMINFNHDNESIDVSAKEMIKTDPSESEIKTEEAVQEIEPELAEQLEEVLVTAQEEIEKEREGRREKWKTETEDDKEGMIEEEKNTIEERLGKRLIKENQNLLEAETPESEGAENQDISEQRNVQEILKSYEKIKKLRDDLETEVNQEMANREEISDNIQTNLTPENADLSQLNSIEMDMLKRSTNDILKTTKNVLSIKEIDYLMETMGPENNFGDLKGTHENRRIEMEKLQDIIEAMEKFKEFVEEFETLNERTLAEQRAEVAQTVAELEHIQKSNKKLFAALVAIGVVAGVVALCLTTGTPLPAFLTAKNVIIAGGAIAAAGTLAYLHKKDKLPSLKQMGEAAKFATGLSLAGGFLAMDSLFNGEKVDKAFKFLCGVGLPSWAEDSKKS